MTQMRRRLACLLIFAVAASGASAQTAAKRKHVPNRRPVPDIARRTDFPNYVDRGSDRNFDGDDLYFNDTKRPYYLVGPGYFQRWQDPILRQ